MVQLSLFWMWNNSTGFNGGAGIKSASFYRYWSEHKMKTKLIRVRPDVPDINKLSQAANIIKKGGLVAFPTETVYGLGASALNEKALRKIFRAKGRPADNPLIVHISRFRDIRLITNYLPVGAKELMKRFWPGPLTLVLPRHPRVPGIVSAGLSTVAVRMPDHPVARGLIRASKLPIAAPSANLSGKPSPTLASHVLKDLAGRIDAVLDGGGCNVGVESTVLDLTGEIPLVLRPGGVTLEQLKEVLNEVNIDPAFQTGRVPKAPGMKYTHYAPNGDLILVGGEDEAVQQSIIKLSRDYGQKNLSIAILSSEEHLFKYKQEAEHHLLMSLGPAKCPEVAANRLYDALRQCDQQKISVILCEAYPKTGMGMALMNRLEKAALKVINV